MLLLLSLLIISIANLELITYGIAQAKGQISIVTDSGSIREVLSDEGFPDSLSRESGS